MIFASFSRSEEEQKLASSFPALPFSPIKKKKEEIAGHAKQIHKEKRVVEESNSTNKGNPDNENNNNISSSSCVVPWSSLLITPQSPGFSPCIPWDERVYAAVVATKTINKSAVTTATTILFSEQENEMNSDTATRNNNDILRSPPRKIVSKPCHSSVSYHGYGLLKAAERGRRLTRLGRRSVLLLLETTNIYDQYAQSLIEAGNNLADTLAIAESCTTPIDYTGSDNNNNNNNNTKLMLSSLQQSIVEWGGETIKLSKTIRTGITRILQNYLVTHGEALNGLQDRYLDCRKNCCIQRQAALQAYERYTDAVNDTEQEIRRWKNSSKHTANTDHTIDEECEYKDNHNTKTELPNSIIEKLKNVKALEAKYKQRVQWENDCVEQAQRFESMALETLQKLEEERLVLFVTAMIKILKSKKEALDRCCVSLLPSAPHTVLPKADSNEYDIDESCQSVWNSSSRREIKTSRSHDSIKSNECSDSAMNDSSMGDYFGRLRFNSATSIGDILTGTMSTSNHTTSNNNSTSKNIAINNNSVNASFMDGMNEIGSGVMDAETLGFPEEVGQLRDRAVSMIEKRVNQVSTAKNLAQFLDSIAAASFKLGQSLKQQNSKAAMNDSETNNVVKTYKNVKELMQVEEEMISAVELWQGLSDALDFEADEALTLAERLECLCIEKLQHIVEDGDKSMKLVTDRDKATWKQLCEAARSQARAERRYQATEAETARARERMKSVDANVEAASNNNQNTKQTAGGQSLASMFDILPNKGEYVIKLFDSETRANFYQKSLQEADQKVMRERQLLNSAVALTGLSIDAYKSTAVSLISTYEADDRRGWANIIPLLESFADNVNSSRIRQNNAFNAIQTVTTRNDLELQINEWSTATCNIIQRLQAECTDSEDSFKLPMLLEVSAALREIRSSQLNGEFNKDAVVDDVTAKNLDDSLIGSPSRNRSASATYEENSAAAWIRRSLSFPETSVGQSIPRQQSQFEACYKYDGVDIETSIFGAYFRPGNVDAKAIPKILTSLACSFRDGGSRLPSQYGRIFISHANLIFVSWTGKQLQLTWSEVLSLSPCKVSLSTADDALRVKCKRNQSDESYMILGGFYDRNSAQKKIEEALEFAANAAEEKRIADGESAVEGREICLPSSTDLGPVEQMTSVPPDETLKKMQIVLSEKLRNISVQRFYEIVWSEGNGTNEKPFYKPFLEKECLDVDVSDWERKSVSGQWCGEKYDQRREVKFKVKRKTHLYIGPPIANAFQTQLCRVEGNDKCVVDFRVELDGIPYGDTFAVQVRWVARRENQFDILVEVGVFVDFKKSTFLKSKIQSGTIEETTSLHRKLFQVAKAACLGASEKGSAYEIEEVIPLVVSKEVQNRPPMDLQSLMDYSLFTKLTSDQTVKLFFAAVIVLTIAVRYFSLKNTINVPSPNIDVYVAEVVALHDHINRLELEIKAVQQTLNGILTILEGNNN